MVPQGAPLLKENKKNKVEFSSWHHTRVLPGVVKQGVQQRASVFHAALFSLIWTYSSLQVSKTCDVWNLQHHRKTCLLPLCCFNTGCTKMSSWNNTYRCPLLLHALLLTLALWFHMCFPLKFCVCCIQCRCLWYDGCHSQVNTGSYKF